MEELATLIKFIIKAILVVFSVVLAWYVFIFVFTIISLSNMPLVEPWASL